MDTTMSEYTLTEDSSNVVGPGARLRMAREAMGLSIEDIASQLHLRPQLIQEIESDDFRAIKRVFLLGYLRSYAKAVKLVADEIIAVFMEIAGEQPATPVVPAAAQVAIPIRHSRFPAKAKLSKIPRLAKYVVGLGIVVLITIWWHTYKGHNTLAFLNKAPEVKAPIIAANRKPHPDDGKIARDFDIHAAAERSTPPPHLDKPIVPWTEVQ